jgi:hypothetical protein
MALSQRRIELARKRHKREEIVTKLRQVDVLVSQGQAVAEAIRLIGVSEVTYYRWRQELGGLMDEVTQSFHLREPFCRGLPQKMPPHVGRLCPCDGIAQRAET